MGGPRPEHSNRLLWFQDLTPIILRSPRSYAANDNRSLPQAVSTAERAELWGRKNGADEGPDACVLAPSGVVPGFIMRPWSVVQ